MTKNSITFSRELTGDNIDDIVADGVEADRLGFDIAWVPDHLVDIRPRRLLRMPGRRWPSSVQRPKSCGWARGLPIFRESIPQRFANIVATLDRLTKGRADSRYRGRRNHEHAAVRYSLGGEEDPDTAPQRNHHCDEAFVEKLV